MKFLKVRNNPRESIVSTITEFKITFKFNLFLIGVIIFSFPSIFSIKITLAEDNFVIAEKQFDKKQYTEAISNYQQALTKYTKGNISAYIQNQIAESYFRQGKYSEAITEFSKIEEKHPTSPFANESRYKIARCYYEQKKYNEAGEEFQKYVEKYPEGIADAKARHTSSALLYSAICYKQSGHPIKAMKMYGRYKESNKGKPTRLDEGLIKKIKGIKKNEK